MTFPAITHETRAQSSCSSSCSSNRSSNSRISSSSSSSCSSSSSSSIRSSNPRGNPAAPPPPLLAPKQDPAVRSPSTSPPPPNSAPNPVPQPTRPSPHPTLPLPLTPFPPPVAPNPDPAVRSPSIPPPPLAPEQDPAVRSPSQGSENDFARGLDEEDIQQPGTPDQQLQAKVKPTAVTSATSPAARESQIGNGVCKSCLAMTDQNCVPCGYPCHAPQYTIRDAFGQQQKCSRQINSAEGISWHCNACAGAPKLDPQTNETLQCKDDLSEQGGFSDPEAGEELPGKPTWSCRYCTAAELRLISGDVWECAACDGKRCSFCKLDDFCGHWSIQSDCSLRLRRHGSGFNFLLLFVSYFSPYQKFKNEVHLRHSCRVS